MTQNINMFIIYLLYRFWFTNYSISFLNFSYLFIHKATEVTKIGIRKRPKVSNTDIRCFERNALKRDFIRKKVFDRMEWSYARKESEIGDPLRLLFPGPKSKKVIHKF